MPNCHQNLKHVALALAAGSGQSLTALEEVGKSLKESKENATRCGKKGHLRYVVAESLAKLLPAVASRMDIKCR